MPTSLSGSGPVAEDVKFAPHTRFWATIRFDPLDILNFADQPQVKVWLNSVTYTKNPETLIYTADFRFEPVNLRDIVPHRFQLWSDERIPIRFKEVGISVILGTSTQGDS